jgi:hypothetical protein
LYLPEHVPALARRQRARAAAEPCCANSQLELPGDGHEICPLAAMRTAGDGHGICPGRRSGLGYARRERRGPARQLTDTLQPSDASAVQALHPTRFADRTDEQLEREALRLYRDIYATVYSN